MLNPKVLRFVVEVADAGSIRKAAVRLNISSSAVNRHILALEEQLGLLLFERLPRRLRLTAAGEVVIEHAQRSNREDQRLFNRLSAIKGMRRGEVRVATMGGLVHSPLLVSAGKFIKEHRGVLVRIEIMPSPDAIVAKVLAGDCDLGLGYNILQNPGLRVLQTVNVDIGVVAAADHSLAKQSTVKLSQCLPYPVATGTPSMVIRGLVEHAFSSADFQFQPTVESDSIEIMKDFVKGGGCITFLNPLDVVAEVEAGEFVYLPFEEKHFPPSQLKLVVRRKGGLENAATRLAEEFSNVMAEMSAASDHRKTRTQNENDLRKV